MIRPRVPGELISGGDVVLIGDKAFPALGTLLVGQVVLRGTVNAVYTSEPVTTLQEPFPAKPARPACANCEAPSEYAFDDEDRAERGRNITVHLCRDCATSLRERLLNA